MKIIIDLTYTPSGGSLTQILNMVEEFNQIKGIEILIYSKKNNAILLNGFINDEQVVLSKLANFSIFTRILWGQFFLPFYLKKQNADILFCPGNFGPIFSPVKTIIWIGTIGPFFKDFYKNFSFFEKIKLYINKFFIISSSRRADSVIFESKFTQTLFINQYKFKKSKSHVINIGLDNFFTTNEKYKITEFESKFIQKKYILCVSHLYPYKNIIRLLHAYSKVLIDNNEVKLVIAGSRDYDKYNLEIECCIVNLNLQEKVILLGKVSKKSLKVLYENSSMFVFPSPFENFAYTLVEAMSCETPIVCSNTTAMPETCQSAALYFDPYNIEEMVEKIKLVLNDEVLRKNMKKRSIIRSKELPNFNQVTMKTLDIMKNLL
jgi:glycosyltransferase involved in cell wall biosynthesis